MMQNKVRMRTKGTGMLEMIDWYRGLMLICHFSKAAIKKHRQVSVLVVRGSLFFDSIHSFS